MSPVELDSTVGEATTGTWDKLKLIGELFGVNTIRDGVSFTDPLHGGAGPTAHVALATHNTFATNWHKYN